MKSEAERERKMREQLATRLSLTQERLDRRRRPRGHELRATRRASIAASTPMPRTAMLPARCSCCAIYAHMACLGTATRPWTLDPGNPSGALVLTLTLSLTLDPGSVTEVTGLRSENAELRLRLDELKVAQVRPLRIALVTT